MKTLPTLSIACLSGVLAYATSLTAQANLILNGGFESGFAGWTVANQAGSDGAFHLQTGSLSPLNGNAVPAPPGGLQAAMTDAFGPGSHVLYQDFVVPASIPNASAGFSLFVGNNAANFFAPATLDFATPALNQRARVDIMLTSADLFGLAAGDILQNLYETVPGDPLMSGYTSSMSDITSLLQAHAGETLRLRIAEVDNVNFFNLGVDNVEISVVPEPAPLMLLLGVLPMAVGFVIYRSRALRKTIPAAPAV
jgi:hypothetical protein